MICAFYGKSQHDMETEKCMLLNSKEENRVDMKKSRFSAVMRWGGRTKLNIRSLLSGVLKGS